MALAEKVENKEEKHTAKSIKTAYVCAFHLYVIFLFLVTPCLVIAVQPCVQ